MTATASRDDPANGAWAQSLALSFRFIYLVVALLGVGWAVSNCRVIASDSRAVVTRFGAVVREQDAGLVLALPRPIEDVVVLPSAGRQIEFKIAPFNSSAPSSQEDGPAAGEINEDPRLNAAFLLTGDFSVVRMKATLFYQITDPVAYVLSRPHVEPALERLFIASTVGVCGSRDLDAILVARPELDQSHALRSSREHLRGDLLNAVNRRLADLAAQGDSLGVTVARVDLFPSIPLDAKESFDSVLRAIQSAETVTAQARTDAETLTQGAQQAKDRTAAEAQAAAEEQIAAAAARTAEITALTHDSTGLSGATLADRLYRDRIGPVLRKAQEVTVVAPNGSHTILPGAL